MKRLTLFLISFLLTSTVISGRAQAAGKGISVEPFLIVVVTPVKDGDGCTQTTQKTNFPLSAESCKDFLEKNGMPTRVDDRDPMMRMTLEPVVPKGTVFAYVFTPSFNGWVKVDTN